MADAMGFSVSETIIGDENLKTIPRLDLGIQPIGNEVQELAVPRVSNVQEIDLVQTEYGMTEALLPQKLGQQSKLRVVDRERAVSRKTG